MFVTFMISSFVTVTFTDLRMFTVTFWSKFGFKKNEKNVKRRYNSKICNHRLAA